MLDILYDIRKMFDKLNNKGKAVVSTILIGSLLTSVGCSILNKSKNTERVYLVDLSDKYQNEAILVDENGNPINIENRFLNPKYNDDILAIVKDDDTKNGELYETILVNSDGEMIKGYMDGKNLEDKGFDSTVVTADVLEEVNTVIAPSGSYIREEKVVDRDTDKAYYVNNGRNIASSKLVETADGRFWQEGDVVDFDNKKLIHGYYVNDYVINTQDFNSIEGKVFRVNTEGSSLKLRSDACIDDSNIIYKIANGEKVILLPSISSINDGNYDWFYVAVNTEEGIKFGYAAATMYTDNETINYLVPERENIVSNESKNKEEVDARIDKVVDTSKDGGVDLKLRETPGISGNVIAKIVNGDIVYTYNKDIENSKNSLAVDGYKWLKVYLTDGQSGYVADKYLKDKEEKDNSIYTMKFGDVEVKGHFGIDVNDKNSPKTFENFVSGNLDYSKLSNPKFRSFTEMKFPEFVMIKIGAGSVVNGSIIEETSEPQRLDNIEGIVSICEERQIPYGFYFYCQAINDKDVDNTVNYLKEVLSRFGGGKYNIFPLYIDEETMYPYYDKSTEKTVSLPTRIYNNAKEKGKAEQTRILNNILTRLNNEVDCDISTYLDVESYRWLVDYNSLVNKDDAWVVDCSDGTRSSYYKNNFPEEFRKEEVVVRQIALDIKVGENKLVDIDFMDDDYFNKQMEKHGLLNKQDEAEEQKVLTR